MTQTPDTRRRSTGGQFLTATAAAPADVFMREDLTDEQRLFGQTAAEFMQQGSAAGRRARSTRTTGR